MMASAAGRKGGDVEGGVGLSRRKSAGGGLVGDGAAGTAAGPAKPNIRVSTPVWIPAGRGNEQSVFEPARVVSIDDGKHECVVQPRSGPELLLPIAQVQLLNPRVVADMTSLYHINDAGILYNLKVRSEQDLPYTNMGSVLVSVNPLHSVPDPELEPGRAMQTSVPHPYSIAETSFRNMTFCFERRQQRVRQLAILERGGHDVREESSVELVVNQSVVISGESGSGKTEAGKRVLRHLVTRAARGGSSCVSEGDSALDVQLAGVGPILESFGNASTVCNHNSSRFGKFSKLHFVQRSQDRVAAKTWDLVGATVETYLLEQSRVVAITEGERNFHVFYQLLRGATAQQRLELGLPDARVATQAFRMLRPDAEEGEVAAAAAPAEASENAPGAANSRASRRAGARSSLVGLGASAATASAAAAPPPSSATATSTASSSASKAGPAGSTKASASVRQGMARRSAIPEAVEAEKDAANFALLKKALGDIGKSSGEMDALLRVVAGLLHLGNVAFEASAGTSDAAHVAAGSRGSLQWAAKLLGVAERELERLLLERELKAGVQTIVSQLDATSARYARDALCKWTYGTVFDWLVGEVNSTLMSGYAERSVPLAQLPFIGVLDIFGFESFAKNGFEQLLINYTNESLQSTFNYQVFVAEADLYKREGLLLAGEPFVCPSDDGDCLDLFEGRPGMVGLLTEIDTESKGPRPDDVKLCRRLHACFGQGVRSFPKPHAKDVASTFLVSHYAGVVQYTVGDFVAKNSDRIPNAMNARLAQSGNAALAAAFRAANASEVQRKKTVVANFAGQIRALVETLESTKCSFIRCVKPNPEMVWAPNTNWFNNLYVNEQLKCLSIPQTAAVLKSGLPTRIDYDAIVQAYDKALPADALAMWRRGAGAQSGRTFCAALFWAFRVPPEAFRLGLTKVFFSSGMIDLLDRIMGEAAAWAADSDSKGGSEKREIGKRFKLYYARLRWRRALAHVVATNKFTRLLHAARSRGHAARTLQRFARAASCRIRIAKHLAKRRTLKQEQERLRKIEQERKLKSDAAQAQHESAVAAAKAKLSKGGLTIDPRSSPLVSPRQDQPHHDGGLPPVGPSGQSLRVAQRSQQKITSGWSLGGMLRTPKGSVNPEFLEIVEQAQTVLKSQNINLQQQNDRLASDLEALKQDIALLKKTMPFTHILHIY